MIREGERGRGKKGGEDKECMHKDRKTRRKTETLRLKSEVEGRRNR